MTVYFKLLWGIEGNDWIDSRKNKKYSFSGGQIMTWPFLCLDREYQQTPAESYFASLHACKYCWTAGPKSWRGGKHVETLKQRARMCEGGEARNVPSRAESANATRSWKQRGKTARPAQSQRLDSSTRGSRQSEVTGNRLSEPRVMWQVLRHLNPSESKWMSPRWAYCAASCLAS